MDLESPDVGSEPKPIADVYRWAQEQAANLRAGRLDVIDALNIADEIDDVGHSEYDKLERALAVLLHHMLKWDHQPDRRSRSWDNTIDEQRHRVVRQLRNNPSLRAKLDTIVNDAFQSARRRASSEMNISRKAFPETCPYLWSDIIERPFVFNPE